MGTMDTGASMGFIAMIAYFAIMAIVLIGSMISSLFMGALTGAAPLVCGLMSGKKKLGIIGFIAGIVFYWMAGAFWALVAALVFVIIIMKGKKVEEPKAEEPVLEEAVAEEAAEEATEE